MSVLELKGELLGMLAQVNEESQLQQIRALILKFLTNARSKPEHLDGLTEEQYAELLLALAESEDEEQLVSQEAVRQMFAQWKNR